MNLSVSNKKININDLTKGIEFIRINTQKPTKSAQKTKNVKVESCNLLNFYL